jgi:uncharacterized protein
VEINDTFDIDASAGVVWERFLDVERVATCMPGAELTEVVDDKTWLGRVRMKIGPVSMKYSGRVVMAERDDDTRTMTLQAEGSEESGKGGATAQVRVSVDPTPTGGSHVAITQDIALSGAAAQFGGRMLADVSAHLVKQFANCLGAQLSGAATAPTVSKDVPALRLAVWAFFRAIGRALRLPWGRSKRAEG